jgi:hypothetical protein
VTIDEMIRALVMAVEDPPPPHTRRLIAVPDIRIACYPPARLEWSARATASGRRT